MRSPDGKWLWGEKKLYRSTARAFASIMRALREANPKFDPDRFLEAVEEEYGAGGGQG